MAVQHVQSRNSITWTNTRITNVELISMISTVMSKQNANCIHNLFIYTMFRWIILRIHFNFITAYSRWFFLSKYINIREIVNILFFSIKKTCVRRISNYQSNDDNKIHRVRKQPSWHLPLTWLPIILYICICGKVIHIPIRIFCATAPLVLLESVKSSVE